MVDRRDQVRRSFFSLIWFMPSIFFMRCASMKGPFLSERDMCSSSVNLLQCWIRRISWVRDLVLLLRESPLPAFDCHAGSYKCPVYLLRRLTMNTSVRLLLRVL